MKFVPPVVASLMPRLIIEEVKTSDTKKPYKLQQPSVLCDEERLKEIHAIHVIIQSPLQFYAAKGLNINPHMRITQEEERKYLDFARAHGFVDDKEHKKVKGIRIYEHTKNYVENNIVRVINYGTDIH